MVLKHEHVIIRAEVNNVPGPDAGKALQAWMSRLIESIGMNLLVGPHAAYVETPGNVGWTCMALIETSHAVIHIWSEPDPKIIQLDVYSCAALPLVKVLEALDVFDPIKVEYKFLDREKDLRVLDHSLLIHEKNVDSDDPVGYC